MKTKEKRRKKREADGKRGERREIGWKREKKMEKQGNNSKKWEIGWRKRGKGEKGERVKT